MIHFGDEKAQAPRQGGISKRRAQKIFLNTHKCFKELIRALEFVLRSEIASRVSRTGDFQMARLFGLMGATVGSALGWWLGAHVGLMTAFLISTVGTGVGLYLGRQIADTYL
jgi:hypothetical protein